MHTTNQVKNVTGGTDALNGVLKRYFRMFYRLQNTKKAEILQIRASTSEVVQYKL